MTVQGEAEAGTELLQWHLDVARVEIDRLRRRLRVHARRTADAVRERDAARTAAERSEALASVDDCAITDMGDNGCHYLRVTGRRRGDSTWGFVWEFESELDDRIHSDNGTHETWSGAFSDLLAGTYQALDESETA